MFGEQKPLEKLPYYFHYLFECEDSQETHKAMIEDWELGVLLLKERDRKGEEAAVESIRHKFLNEIYADSKDTRFFMGTRHPFNQWLVIGTFWPPKQAQGLLFGLIANLWFCEVNDALEPGSFRGQVLELVLKSTIAI